MLDTGIATFDKSILKNENLVLSYNTGSGPASTFLAEYLKYRKETLKQFPIVKSDFSQDYWPEPAHSAAKVGEERAKVMKGKRPFTYPEYMWAYKNRRYLALVKSQAKLLDKSLGENTCTESNFLEL
ncbi:hypothetical protein D3C72_1405520 [compost metagenome]